MKKTLMLAVTVLATVIGFAGAEATQTKAEPVKTATAKPRSVVKREAVRSDAKRGATIDPITVSRAEAMINTKRLVGTHLFTSNVVDEVTGNVTTNDFVRYTYRQAGVTWDEVKPRAQINGIIGPKKYSQYKLLLAAEQAGKAGQLKTLLSSATTPSGLTFWDLFMASDYLREDDENLMNGLRMAVQGGLCTQEELENILEAALD